MDNIVWQTVYFRVPLTHFSLDTFLSDEVLRYSGIALSDMFRTEIPREVFRLDTLVEFGIQVESGKLAFPPLTEIRNYREYVMSDTKNTGRVSADDFFARVNIDAITGIVVFSREMEREYRDFVQQKFPHIAIGYYRDTSAFRNIKVTPSARAKYQIYSERKNETE